MRDRSDDGRKHTEHEQFERIEYAFPVYVALMLWGALYLRDDRVRALIPLRSNR